MKTFLGAFSLAILFACGQFAVAGTISPGVFELFNHPDGAISTPAAPYGLRLDAVPPPGNGPTYDVVADAAPVTLTWFLDNTAMIQGRVKNNTTGEFWKVVNNISGLVVTPDGFKATMSTGTLMYDDVGAPQADINLVGEPNPDGYAFLFLADGHRLPPAESMTVVGRGWFDPGNTTDDWLVIGVQTTIFEIPEPAALALLGIGFLPWVLKRR